MKKTANLITTVLSPFLVPTYGLVMAFSTTALSLVTFKMRAGVTVAIFVMTCIFPLLITGALLKVGYLAMGENGSGNRGRMMPCAVAWVSYAAAAVYLWNANAPMWLVMAFAGAMVAAIVSLAVKSKWDISVDMAAMGGLLGLAMRIAAADIAVVSMVWWVAAVMLCCGAVATSCMALERNSPRQLLAGFFNGFVCVFALSIIF